MKFERPLLRGILVLALVLAAGLAVFVVAIDVPEGVAPLHVLRFHDACFFCHKVPLGTE